MVCVGLFDHDRPSFSPFSVKDHDSLLCSFFWSFNCLGVMNFVESTEFAVDLDLKSNNITCQADSETNLDLLRFKWLPDLDWLLFFDLLSRDLLLVADRVFLDFDRDLLDFERLRCLLLDLNH